MASGHVNRANRPNTWPHRPAAEVKKALANREPSTHGTTRTYRDVRFNAAIRGIADTKSLRSERSDLCEAGLKDTPLGSATRTARLGAGRASIPQGYP